MNNQKSLLIPVVTLAVITAVVSLVLNGRGMGFLSQMPFMMSNGSYDMAVSSMPVSNMGIGGDMGKVAYAEPAIAPDVMPSEYGRKMIMPPIGGGNDALYEKDRFYLQSAYYGVVVDNVETYLRGIREYALSNGGVVLNSSYDKSPDWESGSLYLKIPVTKFAETNQRVTDNVEKVMNESVSNSDITGQVVNNDEYLQQLRDELSILELRMSEAKTAVEKRQIQIDIDRVNRMIKSQEDRSAETIEETQFASVSITAASSEKFYNPEFRGSLWEEFKEAVKSLKGFGKSFAYFMIWVVVYSVVWFPILVIFRKINEMMNGRRDGQM